MQKEIDMDSLEWESDDGPEGEETDEDDWISSEEMREDDWSIAGEVRRMEEGVGDYNSRLYELAVDLGETRLFFGKTSIDRTVDRLEVKEGDVIAIRNTGDTWTFENDDDEEVEVSEFEVALVDKDSDNGGEN